MDIKQTANKFRNSLNLKSKNLTFENISLAIAEQGYQLKFYSESSTLLMSMGLYDESKQADSVSTVDKHHIPYIFISDDLEPPYKLLALAHEIGHIVLEHRKTDSLKRIQEREADLFALYFLSDSNRSNKKMKTALIVESIALSVALIITASFAAYRPDERAVATSAKVSSFSDTQESDTICYYTRYGEVYHIYPDCGYLKNSSTVRSGTIYEANKDRLCSACERRSKNKRSF